MKSTYLQRLWAPALLIALFCGACGGGEKGSPAPAEEVPGLVELYYFYEELCQSCDGLEEFNAIVAEQLAPVGDTYPYRIHTINVYRQENRVLFEQLRADLGLGDNTPELPFLAAGGRVFQGNETIAKNLREAFLTAGEDLFVNRRVYNPAQRKTGDELFAGYAVVPGRRTLVYFYRITCDECNRVKPLIDALPETLDIIRLNTRSGNNGERIAAFFDRYRVPDKDRMVPIVFLEDGYLAGYEAITAELSRRLEGPPQPGLLTGLIGSGR